MFEKFKDSEGLERYAIAGYSTVYEYYAYPANKRPRISQVIIPWNWKFCYFFPTFSKNDDFSFWYVHFYYTILPFFYQKAHNLL